MNHRARSAITASTLVITLVTLTGISLMAAYTLIRVTPRVRMAYQNAAWQESRVTAESGIDAAMNDLLINATGFNPGAWTGWEEGPPPPPPKGTAPKPLRKLRDVASLTDSVIGIVTSLSKKKGKQVKGAAAPPTNVDSTGSLFLDNVKVSAVKGLAAEANIQLWALEPPSNPHARWYRIRSMGTCPLPPTAFQNPANLDAHLRRFSLRTVRPSLKRDDVGSATSISLPNISRTVEVLVEPILSFELALWTGGNLTLPATGTWEIDSFDSSDETKSAAGLYPGRGSPLVQANGSVASSAPPPGTGLFGPTIAANGTRVRGAVATDGCDDLSTKEYENVSGSAALDPERIRSDFGRRMTPLLRPEGEFLPPPLLGSFLTGPESAPTIYSVHGTLTQLRISAPMAGTTGSIVVLIDGDLDLKGPLILPPSVTALVFVRGNITFRDNVNSGPWNSNRANQLLLFGDRPSPLRQSLRAEGNISVCAAFYGPTTDIYLDGGMHWMGSLTGSTFQAGNGGDGGLHYDEALATVGPTIGFRIARYIEDVRQ